MLYSQMLCSTAHATWMSNHNSCCKLDPNIHLLSSSRLWLNKEEKTFMYIYIYIYLYIHIPVRSGLVV